MLFLQRLSVELVWSVRRERVLVEQDRVAPLNLISESSQRSQQSVESCLARVVNSLHSIVSLLFRLLPATAVIPAARPGAPLQI